MKKRDFLNGGGLQYQAPILEQWEFAAERGFADSLGDDWGDGSLEDDENDLGGY